MDEVKTQIVLDSIVEDLIKIVGGQNGGRTYGIGWYKRRLRVRLIELGLRRRDAGYFSPFLAKLIDDYFFDIDKKLSPNNLGVLYSSDFGEGFRTKLYDGLRQDLIDLPY